VKCDERPGSCINCEHLQLACSTDNSTYPQVHQIRHSPRSGRSSLAASGMFKRKRTYRSCPECRSSKTKCTGERPYCLRCREKGLQCIYETDHGPVWIKRLPGITPTTEVTDEEEPNAINDSTEGATVTSIDRDNISRDSPQPVHTRSTSRSHNSEALPW
jgi:hypothetical protein